MTPEQYLEHLEADSARFARFAEGSLDTSVPHLDWTVRDLVGHLGSVYCYAATNAAAASPEPAQLGPEAKPVDGDAVLAWFDERRSVVLETLRGVDDDAIGWTHAGPQPAGWWKRRMACETAIHRWDMEAAVAGAEDTQAIEAELATDVVNEFLETTQAVAVAQPGRITFPTNSLHLHRSDGPGEWMLVADSDGGLIVTEEHSKGDAAVRGPASELALRMWGRPATDIQIFGDESVAAAWQSLSG